MSFDGMSLTFLNDVTNDFPSAIPLAAGQPTSCFYDNLRGSKLHVAMARFERHLEDASSGSSVRSSILQYGSTGGLINDLVAEQLNSDDGLRADSTRVLITAGCQEGLAICLPAVCPAPNDVALFCNPTYIGAVYAAQGNGIAVSYLPNDVKDFAQAIERSAYESQRRGLRVRAVYLIPTFDNPTGRVIPEMQRRQILTTCARLEILVLEDNPYGMFRYEGATLRTLADLDDFGCVLYLSTYSKTLAPALRVGAITVPRALFGSRLASETLLTLLRRRKSFMSVNTSHINQAIVGGILLDQGCSLKEWIAPSLSLYRRNRDTMLSALDAAFEGSSSDISWSRPSGGFFIEVFLPFIFDMEAARVCAAVYGVIVMPMSLFASDDSQKYRIRLAFSGVSMPEINRGIAAFAKYVKSRVYKRS